MIPGIPGITSLKFPFPSLPLAICKFPFPSRKTGMWFSISLPVPGSKKAFPAPHPWVGAFWENLVLVFSNWLIFTHPCIFRRFMADISEPVPRNNFYIVYSVDGRPEKQSIERSIMFVLVTFVTRKNKQIKEFTCNRKLDVCRSEQRPRGSDQTGELLPCAWCHGHGHGWWSGLLSS